MVIERRTDRGSPALEQRIDPRTGTLTVRYAPTWVGVREYRRDDGSISRELHRPEQVASLGFRAQLARLPVPIGHPEDERGPVWLHVDPRAPGPAGYSVREPRDFAVGWTGDLVEDRPCAEYPEIQVPTVQVTYTDARGIDLLKGGALESSLGYDVFVDRTPGVWIAPDGSEHPYDAEHVLDPEDPRLADLNPSERATLGPNHLAALPYGRGGSQSAVRWDSACKSPESGVSAGAAKIGGVSKTRLPLPPEIKRDGMVSIEVPDDPAMLAQLEAMFGSLAAELGSLKSKLGEAEGAAAQAGEQVAKLELELEDLRPMADLGRKLDAERSAEQVKALGIEPKGDSGPAIRSAAVESLLPSAVSRYPAGTKERAVAVDAAFAVLVARPSSQVPKAGEKPLTVVDAAPAPKTPTVAVMGRFNPEA